MTKLLMWLAIRPMKSALRWQVGKSSDVTSRWMGAAWEKKCWHTAGEAHIFSSRRAGLACCHSLCRFGSSNSWLLIRKWSNL